MFKRRNYYGGEGSDSSDSSSSSSASESEEPGGGRLEDLSEGDFDDGAEEESDEEEEEPTGPPWKCAVCHKVLLLSEATLKTHVESKQHKKALGKQPAGLADPIYAAKGTFPAGFPHPNDVDAETHAERMARIRSQKTDAKPKPVDGARQAKRPKLAPEQAARPSKQRRDA